MSFFDKIYDINRTGTLTGILQISFNCYRSLDLCCILNVHKTGNVLYVSIKIAFFCSFALLLILHRFLYYLFVTDYLYSFLFP